jgi:AraC-like DNA-binding protein
MGPHLRLAETSSLAALQPDDITTVGAGMPASRTTAAGNTAARGEPLIAAGPPDLPSPATRLHRCSPEAIRAVNDVRRALERDPEGARAAALRLVALLSSPAAGERPCRRGGLAPWQQRKVDRHMRQRIEGPLRVRELAEQASLSVSYFCRAFKESFGTTPHLHLARLRVERAQRLMLTTGDPLSQIALACGMADQAHLSKLFRRMVGETPSAWRRRSRTDAGRQLRGGPRPSQASGQAEAA